MFVGTIPRNFRYGDSKHKKKDTTLTMCNELKIMIQYQYEVKKKGGKRLHFILLFLFLRRGVLAARV